MTRARGLPAGRRSIFRGKDDSARVQGILTAEGARALDRARDALAALYAEVMQREASAFTVSDADVIEFLARGVENTRRYLRELRQQEKRQEAKAKRQG